MNTLNRFSSRRQRLDHAFLSTRLKGAKSYRRIAGYFRSSIFELVGEEIAAIPKVQIVCNSELDAADVAVSKHVRETALKERWNEAPSEVALELRFGVEHAPQQVGRQEAALEANGLEIGGALHFVPPPRRTSQRPDLRGPTRRSSPSCCSFTICFSMARVERPSAWATWTMVRSALVARRSRI